MNCIFFHYAQANNAQTGIANDAVSQGKIKSTSFSQGKCACDRNKLAFVISRYQIRGVRVNGRSTSGSLYFLKGVYYNTGIAFVLTKWKGKAMVQFVLQIS